MILLISLAKQRTQPTRPLGAQSGINFKSRRVTSYEELKTFATGLTTQSVAYAYWYGNGESGIISGNGATYIVQNWNNGAIVIVASRHNSRNLQTITFDGTNWTINNFFGTDSLDALASALGVGWQYIPTFDSNVPVLSGITSSGGAWVFKYGQLSGYTRAFAFIVCGYEEHYSLYMRNISSNDNITYTYGAPVKIL